MRRREFIAATAALLVSPRRSWAQGTRRRLGFLAVGDGSGQALNQSELALFDGLRSHGWIDGRNLIIEYRFSQPPDRLPASVADLIALSPDVLIACGTAGSRSPEIGNCHHSDCIRGCGRSRGARPRPKPLASRRQHNGSCDLRARRLDRKTNRNPPGTGSWRLENCALGQSGQPNAQADISRGDTPHSPEARRGSADS